MRTTRGLVAVLVVLSATVLLGWGERVPSVGAMGHGQEPVPTSTRPAPPPLPSPTPTPKPHCPKSDRSSQAALAATPTPVPALPEAGSRSDGIPGWSGVLLGGGAALGVGLALRRKGSGGPGLS